MKNLFLTITLLTIATLSNAQINVGVGLTYIENNNQIGLQGKALLGLSDNWGISAGGDYILSKDIAFDINADAHYRFDIGQNGKIHPLAGLNFTKYPDNSDIDIGLNFGVFAAMPIQDRFKLYIEPKVIIGGLKSFVISAGVML